jgi:hypothetical protein
MARQSAFALALVLFLGGCCHDRLGYSAMYPVKYAEIRPRPKSHRVKPARVRNANNSIVMFEDALSGEYDASADDELKRKLVICRGCGPPTSDSRTSSIWPTSSASNFTVDQLSQLFPSLPK